MLVKSQQEVVEGQQKVIEGANVLVKSQQEVVEGQQEVVEGQQKVVEGQQKVVEGQQKVVEGQQKVVEGQQQVVEGQQKVVEGQQKVVEGQQQVVEGANELVESQQEVGDGCHEVGDAMCIDPVVSCEEHFNSAMSILMEDFQMSQGSSDGESESCVEGPDAAPTTADLPLQEVAKVFASDSEEDADSGLATGSAAPSIVSEGGPSPSAAECEIGMEMETDELPKAAPGCSRDEYEDSGPSPAGSEDHQQSNNCDTETVLREIGASFEQVSDLPPPPARLSRYSLEEIFASMMPLGRLSPIPPGPLSELESSEEEAGEPHVSLTCPSDSNRVYATRRPSHQSKDSCSSNTHDQEDTIGKKLGTCPSIPASSPNICRTENNATVQKRNSMKTNIVLSPLLSRRMIPGHSASLPVRPSSAEPALPKMSTRDILLSSCNRVSPQHLPPQLSLESHSWRGRHKGKAVVGRTVVPKGGTASSVKRWTESTPLQKQQPPTEFKAESTAAAVEKCRDGEDSMVVVSLLQSGRRRNNRAPDGEKGVPLVPLKSDMEELTCSKPEPVEGDERRPLPTSCDVTTPAAAPTSPAATGEPACRELLPTDQVAPVVATPSATPSATVERGMGEDSADVQSASGLKDVASVSQCEFSGSTKEANKVEEEEEEMEDGELGSSDEEDVLPSCDQVCASRVSLDQATDGMVESSRAGETRGDRGPPPQTLESVGTKRGPPPPLQKICTTTPGPAAKKQKLLGPPAEGKQSITPLPLVYTHYVCSVCCVCVRVARLCVSRLTGTSAGFAAVAWLDPLVAKDNPSSGKATSKKKGGELCCVMSCLLRRQL